MTIFSDIVKHRLTETDTMDIDLALILREINTFQNVLWNSAKHTKEEMDAAKRQIEMLRQQISRYNETTVREINTILDTTVPRLKVFAYNGAQLMIAGNYDLTYYHTLEIVFDNIFYISGPLWEWDTPHPQTTLRIEKNGPDPENTAYAEDENGSFFIFSSDERKNHLIVGASTIFYNTDEVSHSEAENPNENKRVYRPHIFVMTNKKRIPTTVQIVEGDLLDLDVDVIVNAWNRNIIPWWLLLPQGVSGAIKRRGGYEPFRELAKYGPIPLGGAVHTTVGKLPFKGIIHVAGINMLWFATETSIRKSVQSALRLATEKGYRSIAFPMIGAGTGGASQQKTLDMIREEIEHSRYEGEAIIVKYKK